MRDTDAFLKELKDRGYTAVPAGSGHIKLYWGTHLVSTASLTPSGGNRSLKNLRAQISRFERERPQVPGGTQEEEDT
jgi:hypothetical protein